MAESSDQINKKAIAKWWKEKSKESPSRKLLSPGLEAFSQELDAFLRARGTRVILDLGGTVGEPAKHPAVCADCRRTVNPGEAFHEDTCLACEQTWFLVHIVCNNLLLLPGEWRGLSASVSVDAARFVQGLALANSLDTYNREHEALTDELDREDQAELAWQELMAGTSLIPEREDLRDTEEDLFALMDEPTEAAETALAEFLFYWMSKCGLAQEEIPWASRFLISRLDPLKQLATLGQEDPNA